LIKALCAGAAIDAALLSAVVDVVYRYAARRYTTLRYAAARYMLMR